MYSEAGNFELFVLKGQAIEVVDKTGYKLVMLLSTFRCYPVTYTMY